MSVLTRYAAHRGAGFRTTVISMVAAMMAVSLLSQSASAACARSADPTQCDLDMVYIQELSGNGAHFLDDLRSNIAEMASKIANSYKRGVRFSLWGYDAGQKVESYSMLTDLKDDRTQSQLSRMTDQLVSAERRFSGAALDDSPTLQMPVFEAFRKAVTDPNLGLPLVPDPDDLSLRVAIMTSSGSDPKATDDELSLIGRFLVDHKIHLFVCRHEHVQDYFQHYRDVLPKNYFSHATCKFGQIGRPGTKTLTNAVKNGARDLFYDDEFWKPPPPPPTAKPITTTTTTAGGGGFTFPPFTFPIDPTWPTNWPTLPPYPSTTKTTTSTSYTTTTTTTTETDPWTVIPTAPSPTKAAKKGAPVFAPLAGAFGGVALLVGAGLGGYYIYKRRGETAGAEEIDEEAWENEIDHFIQDPADLERSASVGQDEYTDF